MKSIRALTPEIIAAKTAPTDRGCWEWRGAPLQTSGYCRVKMGGVSVMAHRAVYEALVGPIPAGLQLDHLCRNRRCVRPDHLEPVTASVNQRRGTSPASENANKTACARGHALSGSNLFVRKDGRRLCRACKRAGESRARATDVYRAAHAAQERARRARRREQTTQHQEAR